MRFYWLLLATLCVWRLTHLLQAEDGPGEFFVRLRRKVGSGFCGALLDCFYCLSLWIAAPIAYLIGEGWVERMLLWPAPRERDPAEAATTQQVVHCRPIIPKTRESIMSCCGKRRAQMLQAAPPPRAIEPSGVMNHVWTSRQSVVQFEYLGTTAMTVVGSISGRRDRFETPGAGSRLTCVIDLPLPPCPTLAR